MKNLRRTAMHAILLFCLSSLLQHVHAQTGSFTATFTPADNRIKPVTVSFTKPVFKFDNPHGYWFINPHNNYKHFNTKPDQGYSDRKEELNGIAFINLNQTDNDIDVYEFNDSISLSLQKNKYIIAAPKYDPQIGDQNKPLHIHISSISSSEISFTLSGTASLTLTEGYDKASLGTITGSGHFYRQPQYAKSDILPGCNCDPTIYATVLDDDNLVRTTSACEKAFNNKLFDAVQKSLASLFTNVAGASNIIITMLPGASDISIAVQDRPYCSRDYFHNGLTGIDAHKKLFSNDDRFGLRFIHTLSNAEMGAGATYMIPTVTEADGEKMKSFYAELLAKTITEEQYKKKVADFLKSKTVAAGSDNNVDLKKLEAENNLYIHIIINPENKTQTDLKMDDNNKVVITHNIKGAVFETFVPLFKDGDGNWVNSRQAIYFGKFSTPIKTSGAESTKCSYPPNANKLGVYNIIIKMEGGKDLMDKAIANIDFDVLQNLINK